MGNIAGFIHLLAGAANGLLTLEGQNSSCADVFYVWVCIAYQLDKVLTNPSIGVSDYWSSVIEVYNHRFNQMMTESSHNIFLLGYYLHPRKYTYLLSNATFNIDSNFMYKVFRHNGGLHLPLPTPVEGKSLKEKINRCPNLFQTLLTSALEIFKGEQLRVQDSGSEVVIPLIHQFFNYAYNKEPFFSHRWNRETKPLKWWSQISKDSNAQLLAVHMNNPLIII